MDEPNGTAALCRVGIVGYGYVGRATAHALSEVAAIGWHDPAHADSRPMSALAQWADVLVVCVPTPMGESGAAEVGRVREVVQQLAALGVAVPILLKSTVPPGTTEALAREWPDLALVFNPEFLRERHSMRDATAPSRVVLGWTGGVSPAQRLAVGHLYARRFPRTAIVELCATEAELLKYSSNALFGVKVAFANEMAELAGRLGVAWEPVRAALVLDPRVGDDHLAVPGPDGERGFGGTCLPKDMAGLLAVATGLEVELDVVASAVRANRRWRSE